MAYVDIQVGGRAYTIACRAGGEDHLRGLAALVDAKAKEASAAVGSVNEARQLLFAALLLADEASAAPVSVPVVDTGAPLTALAARIEAIADRLEAAALEDVDPTA